VDTPDPKTIGEAPVSRVLGEPYRLGSQGGTLLTRAYPRLGRFRRSRSATPLATSATATLARQVAACGLSD
jgi:hypothetical protein